ncbi:MAG: glycosyltransferase family 2 protein [Paracoccaceae bacterium]
MTAQAAAPPEDLPGLSVIIPANDEAETIGACLSALLDSTLPRGMPVQVIVAANGCTDDTAARARSVGGQAAARGWLLQVLDLPEGGKPGALNAADAVASGPLRVYLDADVIVSPDLLVQIGRALAVDAPRWASGTVRIPRAQSRLTRAYARIYRRVPFMTRGVPGCGLFAVNAAGRARWGAFPDVIADDTFVRLHFTPDERIGLPASYDWPLVEGWANLVKVRRRQDAGVAEIARRFPELLQRDDKPALGAGGMARLALSDPPGFAVYAGVALAVRATRHRRDGWSRGR